MNIYLFRIQQSKEPTLCLSLECEIILYLLKDASLYVVKIRFNF